MMDIYDDLDNFLDVPDSEQLLSENKELKIKLEENSETLNKLKEDFDRLSSEHQLLLKNFSALLKTAKAEIERKTQTILQINIEKDELFLRLANSRFNGKRPMSQKNNINERLLPQETKTTVSPVNEVPDYKDVSRKEIIDSRNKKHFTRQQKSNIDKSNLKDLQNTSKNLAPNEPKESYRDKENQMKCSDTRVEHVGMIVDARTQNAYKYTAYSSDEEDGEVNEETIDLRNKLMKVRSQESTHPYSHAKDDSRANKHSRNNQYEINERDLYRHKDKFKERSDLKGSAERQYRSRAPEREFANEKYYQRGRSRHRVDSPSDRYYRDKSRGRREYKQDRYANESESRVNERVKHKASDGDSSEPSKKRRRHSMYEGPEEGRSSRQSEHYQPMESAQNTVCAETTTERDTSSFFSERFGATNDSCQSPDDAFAERNVTTQPLKLISHTATTKLDDPRQSSRRYIHIQDRDNKLNLVAARSTKVHLMKVPQWGVVDSKPADEDKVREIYADIDKQIINMSIEADKSGEKKDKVIDRKENITERDGKCTKTKRKSEDKIVVDKKLLSLPNDIATSILKDKEVKEAIQSLIEPVAPIKKYVIPKMISSKETEKTKFTEDNTVPIKKYIVPKQISSNEIEETNFPKDNTVSKKFGDKNEQTASSKVVKQLPNEPKTQDLIDKNVAKHKVEKIQKDDNLVHNKHEPEILKPQPCYPLQILFNHLKLAQANNQTQETTSSKDDINTESDKNKLLSNTEAKPSTNDIKIVQKSIVEGDLELSDETSDFTQFNEQYKQKAETPKKKKTKKASPTKAVKDSPNKTVKNPNDTNIESNLNKKTQEIKAKFSDLFGDTSCSLITPEDLNLPRPALENYPCMPSMDSTNEPWSLGNSPWKPDSDNPEQKIKKVIEDVKEKEIEVKPNAIETNVKICQKYHKTDESSTAKACDNNIKDKLQKDVQPIKDVSAPIITKPNATLTNGLENHNDLQLDYKTPIKALATSTPLRPNDKITNKSKITAGSLSIIPEDSVSKVRECSVSNVPESSISNVPESSISNVPEETTDLLKDLSVSDSSKSHTAAEIDTPDVRIVIKRKKRVYKK